jgi:hypothetical protein
VAEEALVSSIAEYRKLRPTLEKALQDLGVTGTVGQAALARIDETIAGLEAVQAVAVEAHAEMETLRTGLGFRHVAGLPKWWLEAQAEEETRAA